MMLMKQLIFYVSFLYFPFVIAMGWLMIRRSGFYRWGALSLVLLSSVPAYARFVEPRILRTIEAEIALAGSPAEDGNDIRLLLFSDTHIGMFGNAMPLERIRERADTLDFDAVLVAGDLTYHLPEDQIEAAFHELNNFGKPVFVVFGNHDVGFPGPDLGMQLAGYFATLENVHLLNNRTEVLTLNGREIWLTGTSDLWQGQIEYPTENPPTGTPRIILTHNPDVAMRVPPNVRYDVLFAGHTHGGQIRIPGLYQRALPSQYGFDRGLYEEVTPASAAAIAETHQIYITSGTGMVGLPMRLLMPPQVDLITVRLPRGEDG
ncbi:metallophosphoesterase [Ponticaulis sp.]|uniref:metallophosphoesterase n=1 Tax=Ponticaulis sp. TaxID=2020902 RepID=UPI000C62A533|nr:metallophosphoesterase [Ponticaulis sp.]MAJ10289.1 hypothetical protein [Ponticaulis sp.]HBH89078.1 hypothetical protein [Hyphomonadaceae bacterium]|tara:strand:+ start:6246 stop:7202 length:957 start_codon:yes stop_codon:yes gene_type:complete